MITCSFCSVFALRMCEFVQAERQDNDNTSFTFLTLRDGTENTTSHEDFSNKNNVHFGHKGKLQVWEFNFTTRLARRSSRHNRAAAWERSYENLFGPRLFTPRLETSEKVHRKHIKHETENEYNFPEASKKTHPNWTRSKCWLKLLFSFQVLCHDCFKFCCFVLIISVYCRMSCESLGLLSHFLPDDVDMFCFCCLYER